MSIQSLQLCGIGIPLEESETIPGGAANRIHQCCQGLDNDNFGSYGDSRVDRIILQIVRDAKGILRAVDQETTQNQTGGLLDKLTVVCELKTLVMDLQNVENKMRQAYDRQFHTFAAGQSMGYLTVMQCIDERTEQIVGLMQDINDRAAILEQQMISERKHKIEIVNAITLAPTEIVTMISQYISLE